MKNYKKYIFTGIMSIIPLALTMWIIENLFIFFSKPGKAIINIFFNYNKFNFLDNYIIYFLYILEYIFGFALTILFLYILGLIISNVIGKKLYQFFELLLNKIPIVSKIYSTI